MKWQREACWYQNRWFIDIVLKIICFISCKLPYFKSRAHLKDFEKILSSQVADRDDNRNDKWAMIWALLISNVNAGGNLHQQRPPRFTQCFHCHSLCEIWPTFKIVWNGHCQKYSVMQCMCMCRRWDPGRAEIMEEGLRIQKWNIWIWVLLKAP